MSNNTLHTSQAQENVSLRLLWTNMNDTHYIESNTGNDQKGLYHICGSEQMTAIFKSHLFKTFLMQLYYTAVQNLLETAGVVLDWI